VARDRARLVENFPRFLDEYERMLTGNEIMLARTQGIGRLDGSRAINAGLTGPVLRASGVDYDVRKVDGYGFYPRFAFRVPLGEHATATTATCCASSKCVSR